MHTPLVPGCFGSALTAQEQSHTCQVCPLKEACFDKVARDEPELMRHLERKLVTRDATARTRALWYIQQRKRSARTVEPSGNARSDVLRKRFADERLDLSAIPRRVNPFPIQTHPMFHHMAAFVILGEPFKPKDMTEYVQANWDGGLTTSSLKSEVARFASVLVAEGILERKEKRILCLA